MIIFRLVSVNKILTNQCKRWLSQISITRAVFGISEAERKRDESITDPPPLVIISLIYVTKYHILCIC